MNCNATDMTIISNCNTESLLNMIHHKRCKIIQVSVVSVLQLSTSPTLKSFTVITSNVHSDMLKTSAIITDSPHLLPPPQHLSDAYD